jgi:hypothetical protein
VSSSRCLPASSIRRVLLLAASLLAVCAMASASASAATGSWWHLDTITSPTNLAPGSEGQLILLASNFGFEGMSASEAEPIKIVDQLPPWLTAVSVAGYSGLGGRHSLATNLKCEATPVPTCVRPKTLPPYEGLEMVITVKVASTVTPQQLEEANEFKVEGGTGVPASSLRERLNVSGAPTTFGVHKYELRPETDTGALDTNAGSHPFQLTTKLDLNQILKPQGTPTPTPEGAAPALTRDLHFVLPAGLLGNPTVLPQCSSADFASIREADINFCPANTAIGAARVMLDEPNFFNGVLTETVPVFNLVPERGEPARFGLTIAKVLIILTTRVRTGDDYAVEVSSTNTTQVAGLLGTEVTFWGVPGDPRHDASRGWECLNEGQAVRSIEPLKPCVPQKEASPPPFITLQTSCASSPTTSVFGVSWAGEPLAEKSFSTPPLEGCGELPFSPSIGVETDTHSTSSPTGMTVKVHVPQDTTLASTLESNPVAESDVKNTTVALPPGVEASPGAANGLLACSAGQFGLLGGFPESAQTENTHFSPGSAECPDEAKIGSVAIHTPLLEHELTGSVYLASQNTNPFGSPLVLYIFAEDPVSGVRVKLAGTVAIDQGTGQLTSTFSQTPPVPFEDLTLTLFGGPRASQSTPSQCGTYTTKALFDPWSQGASVPGSADFSINSGPGGGACPSNPQPFSPSLVAGATDTTQAGAFSGFSVTIGHGDSDQPLNGIEVHLPLGAAGMISSVTPCPEPPVGQEWSCGADSLIGKTSSSSGFGSTPFTLPGKAYLTTGYNGAPFGLLVSTNAEHAGPFNLGVINVRSRINVDKNTAQVTTTTDPGPRNELVPTRIKGVPVDLKQINVTVDRPKFTFNPTNCSPLATTSTLHGSQGASASPSSPFGVSGCDKLPFKPKLTASTQGNASKVNGASLKVKVEAAPGEANIAKTKLVLPITLPSRLTTIQKACRDTVFEVNPAACDEGSNIGTATVHTPVLKNPLTGPAYLVSHGNAGFPDVEFVLQGEGITLILDGQTDIKKGITTSTFNAVPDAPVTTFETTLPEGPHSALTSNVPESKHFSLCGQKLVIPTTITGQNGAVIQQETKVPVTGCTGVLGKRETPLAKALKKCRKQFKHSKKKRTACEKKAHKKYDKKKKKGKKKSSKKKK